MNKFEYSVTFNNAPKGSVVGTITLPGRLTQFVGDIEFEVIAYDGGTVDLIHNEPGEPINRISVRGCYRYTDYKSRTVSIGCSGLTVWNELKLTITIEE